MRRIRLDLLRPRAAGVQHVDGSDMIPLRTATTIVMLGKHVLVATRKCRRLSRPASPSRLKSRAVSNVFEIRPLIVGLRSASTAAGRQQSHRRTPRFEQSSKHDNLRANQMMRAASTFRLSSTIRNQRGALQRSTQFIATCTLSPAAACRCQPH
jgi:hypothetical protein